MEHNWIKTTGLDTCKNCGQWKIESIINTPCISVVVEPQLTNVGLTIREQELLILMKWIDAQGGFSLKPGRLTIDFNCKGELEHFNISQTYNGIARIQIQA